MAILQRTEAVERAALLDVESYEVDLDLTTGAEIFGSRSRITFSCTEPGASTFLDLKAVSVETIELNGASVDPATVADGRVTLADLQERNHLEVVATMRYSRDGQGLHRATDPADGEDYVYGMNFLDAAPQVYACFDQPDLKAPYSVRITAPSDWIVAGNGAEERDGDVWTLATTDPLSTYFMCVIAGPYEVVRDEHCGIPLGVYARASLAEELKRHAPQILEVTKAGLDYYGQLFGIEYPWRKYDQIFVPEFNAGAMENPGCVTFRDQYLFRGTPSRAELLQRTTTVLHEMAHMWFGDLVSMKWWDDLWLNESFAEYMAHRSSVACTEFTTSWVDFSVMRKSWGYQADRSPSTHPIAGNAAEDSDAALANFDGISYAKGCSALRQLAAFVGDDNFIAGVSDYLAAHSFGNATLADFLAAIGRHTDADLTAWSKAWLETTGADVFEVEIDGDPIRAARVNVVEPEGREGARRPHAFDVAGISGGKVQWKVDAVLRAGEPDVAEMVGKPRPAIVLPNASDLTWGNVRLDDDSLAAVPGELAQSDEPIIRGVLWSTLLNGAILAHIDPRLVLDAFEQAWPVETDESIRPQVAKLVRDRITLLLPATERPEAVRRVAKAAAQVLAHSEGDDALVPARVLAGASDDADLLRRWVDGAELPSVVEGDTEFRWAALIRLAELGHADADLIGAVAADDNTLAGAQFALAARAARPDAAAKEEAWATLESDDSLSNYDAAAIAGSLFRGEGASFDGGVDRYFALVPGLEKRFGQFASQAIVNVGFPLAISDPAIVERARVMASGGEIGANSARALVDSAAKLEECLRSQERFGR